MTAAPFTPVYRFPVYLERALDDNVRHAEIFFDPQAHTGRGVALATVVEGICGALDEGERRLGITSRLIPNFLRDLDESGAGLMRIS